MLEWFNLFVFSFCAWRLSSLLCHEDGPYAIFRRVRERLEETGNELFYQLVHCVWCTSIWISFGLILFWLAAPELTRLFAIIMTGSTIAILLQTVIEKMKEGDE